MREYTQWGKNMSLFTNTHTHIKWERKSERKSLFVLGSVCKLINGNLRHPFKILHTVSGAGLNGTGGLKIEKKRKEKASRLPVIND